ncbi:hypothetical protein SAMN05421759_1042 [Roseivivax lentus]|uniref:Lipoprotein n=1 Tax=Roseivivax lentus TaxID=633194 RepID=A0A1N7M5P4_9RHOB|nr:hypothetical protein [Roseivivax lentus]SIS81415.1 hypothetical protein SAMN05421759_1042 [Roseivivax lentus]
MRRLFPLLACLTFLAACADGARQLNKPVEPIGDFKLGHAVVIAPNIVKGPASRDATDEEWIAAVDSAIETRFRRYQGDRFFHLGVSIEGYVLAQPGIPLVFTPKSALIVNVTVFEDATGQKLNEEAMQLSALEAPSKDTFIVGSGLGQTKEEQMAALSANIALSIETWMRKQQRDAGWFGGPDAGVPIVPEPAEEVAPEAAAETADADTGEAAEVMAAVEEPELSAPAN